MAYFDLYAWIAVSTTVLYLCCCLMLWRYCKHTMSPTHMVATAHPALTARHNMDPHHNRRQTDPAESGSSETSVYSQRPLFQVEVFAAPYSPRLECIMHSFPPPSYSEMLVQTCGCSETSCQRCSCPLSADPIDRPPSYDDVIKSDGQSFSNSLTT